MIARNAGDEKLDVVVLFASDGYAGRCEFHVGSRSGTVQKKEFHDLSPNKFVGAGAAPASPDGRAFSSQNRQGGKAVR